MSHSHGNQYQIRTAYEDGTEELTGWMDSEEQLAQAMATVRTAHGKAYWVQVRNVLCSECFDQDQQTIVETPITDIPSPRYRPHNSHYLLALGSKNRYEVFEAVLGARH